MELISVRQWMRQGIDRDLLVDLRSRACFARGHLPGAVCMPYDEREAWLAELPQNQQIVFICKRGTTAIQMAQMLERRGYRTAAIAGGYHQLGYPNCD